MKYRNIIRALFLIAAITGFIVVTVISKGGCESGNTAPVSKFATSGTNASPTPLAEVTLATGTVEDVDAAIKASDKKVVLVEFWSMATEPSSELGMVTNTRGGIQQAQGASLTNDKVAWHGVRKAEYLAHKYEGYLFRIVAVNIDGAEKNDAVLEFLKKHDAKYLKNLQLKEPSSAQEKYGFTGKTPHQVLFDRQGIKVWATGEPLPTANLDNLIFRELDK